MGILPWQPKDGWIKQISPGFLTIPLPNCEIQNQCEALETIFINGVRTSERLIVSLPWNLIIPDNKSEEFLQVLQFWWLALRNFREFFENKFLWLIPRKFLRNSPELVPNLRDFEGFRVLRISFEKFLRFSPKFFPRNSWQIFWNISLERTCQIIRWDV